MSDRAKATMALQIVLRAVDEWILRRPNERVDRGLDEVQAAISGHLDGESLAVLSPPS